METTQQKASVAGARISQLMEKVTFRLTLGYYTMKARQWASATPMTKRAAIRLVQRLIPKRPLGGRTASRVSSDPVDASRLLDRDGFVRLGRIIDQPVIDELIAYTDSQLAVDPWNPQRPKFDRRRPPPDAHTAQFFRRALLGSNRVLELANDPRVLEIARRYLGATPTLSDLNAWWSFPGPRKPKEAQLFHRDRDDLRFCKLMVYLTDVDMTTGPHVYVRGSNSDDRLLVARRHSDEEVEQTFGKDRIEYFCEPAGTAFFVDTGGMHKGLLPTHGERLILEIHYSLMPIGRERYSKDPKVELAPGYDAYVNRLIAR